MISGIGILNDDLANEHDLKIMEDSKVLLRITKKSSVCYNQTGYFTKRLYWEEILIPDNTCNQLRQNP